MLKLQCLSYSFLVVHLKGYCKELHQNFRENLTNQEHHLKTKAEK